MKILLPLLSLLLLSVACSTPEEKLEKRQAKAQEEYREDMKEAQEEYKDDQKEEAKDMVDDADEVQIKNKEEIQVED